MSFDADAYRRASLQGWEESAVAWVRRHDLMSTFAAPVIPSTTVLDWPADSVPTWAGSRKK